MNNKKFALVLAMVVMAATAAWGTATPSTLSADGTFGHISHGCLLCHTPHAAGQLQYNPAASSTAFPAGVLSAGVTQPSSWLPAGAGQNRAVSVYLWLNPLSPVVYTTWDGSSLKASGNENSQQPEVHSLLCLSCHDGAVTGNTHDMGGTLGSTGTTAPSGATNTPTYNLPNYTGTSVTLYGQGGMAGPNHGWSANGDLQSTHPVHAVYPTSGQVNGAVSLWKVSISGGAGSTVTFTDQSFDLGVAAATGGEAMGHPAKLYTDGSFAYVECTSCHEPHRETNYAYKNGSNWLIGGANSTAFYIRGPFGAPLAELPHSGGNSNPNGMANANFCRSCHYDKSLAYVTASGAAQ
jgi:hypothetical protein